MTAALSELIRRKEELLRRLLPISVCQLEIVRRSDMTALLQHLGQKQRVMDEFEDVERLLAPFREIPPEKRKWKDETERLETGAAMERCTAMLEEILRNDSISTEELSIQKTEVKEQLRRVRQGSHVSSAYRQNR